MSHYHIRKGILQAKGGTIPEPTGRPHQSAFRYQPSAPSAVSNDGYRRHHRHHHRQHRRHRPRLRPRVCSWGWNQATNALTASKISVHAGRISEVAGWKPLLPVDEEEAKGGMHSLIGSRGRWLSFFVFSSTSSWLSFVLFSST